MAVTLSKSPEELHQLPLVELAWEILKAKKEPYYFRDLMNEIQQLRNMTEDEVMNAIARLYTEINIDGRFLCIGQNIWGLKRWYPVDKVADKSPSGKRFVRRSGDAFSDDDEDLDEDFEDDDLAVEDEVEAIALFGNNDDADDDGEAELEDDLVVEDEDAEEDADFAEDDEEGALSEDDEMLDEDTEDEEPEDEEPEDDKDHH